MDVRTMVKGAGVEEVALALRFVAENDHLVTSEDQRDALIASLAHPSLELSTARLLYSDLLELLLQRSRLLDPSAESLARAILYSRSEKAFGTPDQLCERAEGYVTSEIDRTCRTLASGTVR